MVEKSKRLGEMLVEAGLVTLPQLERALDWQKARGGRLGMTLVSMAVLTEAELMTFLAKKTGTRVVCLSETAVEQRVLDLVPVDLVEKYNVVPVEMRDPHTLVLACADPTDVVCFDELEFATGYHLVPVVASFAEVVSAINRWYRGIAVNDEEGGGALADASSDVLKSRPERKRLGEKLMEAGMVTRADLRHALRMQEVRGGLLGANLVAIGALEEQTLLRFLARQSGLREVDLSQVAVSDELLKRIPKRLVERFQVVPVAFHPPRTLVVACADPTNLDALDQVRFVIGGRIEPVLASQTAISEFIRAHYEEAIPVKRGRGQVIKDVAAQRKAYFEGRRIDLEFGTPARGDPEILIFDRSVEEEGG